MEKRLLHPWSGGDGSAGFHYWCPGCEGPHGVRITAAEGTAQACWTYDGNEEAPTFGPSILTRGGANPKLVCHCYVKLGQIQFLSDCTHALAGQTVPMEEGPEWFRE
jgi:hypothetical protein